MIFKTENFGARAAAEIDDFWNLTLKYILDRQKFVGFQKSKKYKITPLYGT